MVGGCRLVAANGSIRNIANARCMSDDRPAHPVTARKPLREALRKRRRALTPGARIDAATRVATRLLALPFVPAAGYVAGYWSMDGELALHVWQLQLPPGLVYCLPKLHDDGCLRFAPWRPGDALVHNRFGIPEPDVVETSQLPPERMSMVIMPLVGFDARGQRLGMGAGWYDRSFAFRRANAPPPWLVGAAFAAQQVPALDAEPWDVPMDALCSESETFMFPQAREAPQK